MAASSPDAARPPREGNPRPSGNPPGEGSDRGISERRGAWPRDLEDYDYEDYEDYEGKERFEKIDELSVGGKDIPVVIDHGKEYVEADRYLVITEEVLEQWGELDSAEAIVVRAPDKLGPRPERKITKIIEVLKLK